MATSANSWGSRASTADWPGCSSVTSANISEMLGCTAEKLVNILDCSESTRAMLVSTSAMWVNIWERPECTVAIRASTMAKPVNSSVMLANISDC